MKLQSTLTALAKVLQHLQERGFRASPITLRSLISAAVLSLLMAGLFPANAGEPCQWNRVPNNPAPFQFDTYHGETIDFRCTFVGFSSLPFAGSGYSSPRLYYQTNGMAAAWWDIPATVSTTVVTNCQPPITNYQLSATFPPDRDPGAERLAVFFGAPSNAYAAAQVRFRNSPGAHPNHLEPPSVLDWQAELSSATNALWESSAAAFMPKTDAYTKSETDARITELAPRTSLEPATNYTDNAVEIAYHDAVDYIDRVARRILTTNDVCNIVTNVVGVMIAPKQWWQYEWAPDVQWIEANGDTNKAYYCLAQIKFEDGRWEASYDERFWSDYYENWDGDGWMVYGEGGEDAEEVTFEVDGGAHRWITVTRKTSNALGLARLTDVAPTVSNTVTKAYVENLGIETGVSEATVTNVVRSVAYAVNDYIWDGDVCWRRQMLQGGYLEYVAVTNIDVTLPENYKALEALEKARRNQE